MRESDQFWDALPTVSALPTTSTRAPGSALTVWATVAIAAGVPPDEIRMSWTGEDQLNVPTGNNVSEWRNRTVDIMVP